MVWIEKPADATVPLIFIFFLQNILHAMLYNVFNRTCCSPCALYICHTVSVFPTVLCPITKGTFKSSLFVLSKNARPKFRGDRPELFPDQSGQTPHLPGTFIILSINGTPLKHKQYCLGLIQLVY